MIECFWIPAFAGMTVSFRGNDCEGDGNDIEGDSYGH